jgi:hypothetical protein
VRVGRSAGRVDRMSFEALGQIDVQPPLTAGERDHLRDEMVPDCPWILCRDGCCLRLDGGDREDAAEWLDELLGFLAEGAHTATGMVVAARDDGEIFTVRVTRNRVYDRVLRSASSDRRRPIAAVIDLQERRTVRR